MKIEEGRNEDRRRRIGDEANYACQHALDKANMNVFSERAVCLLCLHTWLCTQYEIHYLPHSPIPAF